MKKKTSRPRIEDQAHYQKIGRLRKPVADEINQPSADIYIDDNHLKHILIRHKEDLEKLGFTPLAFVDLVVGKFNRIYKLEGRQSIWLVRWNGIAKVTVIELNFALKEGFYEIKTAFVAPKSRFKNCILLWKKK
jgi:hypothetical protein